MKKFLFLTITLLTLAACSAHTIIAADVDVLSLADDPDSLKGDVTIPGNIHLYVPDADDNLYTPDGGYLVEGLPALNDLYGFEIKLAVLIKNTGSGELTLDVDFRLSSHDDTTNIYDHIKDVSLASDTIKLNAGESKVLRLESSLERDDPNLSLISNEGFRIGVSLTATGSTSAYYELTEFNILVKERPFDFLPHP